MAVKHLPWNSTEGKLLFCEFSSHTVSQIWRASGSSDTISDWIILGAREVSLNIHVEFPAILSTSFRCGNSTAIGTTDKSVIGTKAKGLLQLETAVSPLLPAALFSRRTWGLLVPTAPTGPSFILQSPAGPSSFRQPQQGRLTIKPFVSQHFNCVAAELELLGKTREKGYLFSLLHNLGCTDKNKTPAYARAVCRWLNHKCTRTRADSTLTHSIASPPPPPPPPVSNLSCPSLYLFSICQTNIIINPPLRQHHPPPSRPLAVRHCPTLHPPAGHCNLIFFF